MNDRTNMTEMSEELKASVDARVREALAAEYEREQTRTTRAPVGRRLAFASLAAIAVLATIGGLVWARAPGPESAVTKTTLPVAIPPPTVTAVTPPTTPTPQLTATEELTASLVRQGAVLTANESLLSSLGLTGVPAHYCLNGSPLLIFEYSSVADRQRESDGISSDAQVTVGQGTDATLTITQWIAAPLFFAHDRLIVLALGPDSATIDTLGTLLGNTITPEAPGPSASGLCESG